MLTEMQKNEKGRERKRWLWAICLGITLGVLTGSLSFINSLGGIGIGTTVFIIFMLSTSPEPPDIER